MHQSVFARNQFNKGTKLLNASDGTHINFTDLHFTYNAFDNTAGFLNHRFVRRANEDTAILLDIDLHAGFFNDFIDNLATCADDITDFVRIDVDDNDFGSIFGQAWSRLGDGFHHFAQDEHPSFFGLLQRILKNLAVNAGDLDIHLNRCNPFSRTCHLEVHIAQMIFHPLNIGQDRDMLSVFDQTHGYTGYRRLNRHTRIHHGQDAGANTRLGS
ncbi:hypothetical protein D3C73_1025140 [compost metagenome]